jgi:hypothetical protein
MQIIVNIWAIHKGANKLAHFKGFAFDKEYEALGANAGGSRNVFRKSRQQDDNGL